MLTNYDFYCKQGKHIWEVSAYTAYNDFRIIRLFFLPLTANFCCQIRKKRIITAWRSERRDHRSL